MLQSPRKAAASKDTHAAAPDEALAILEVLGTAGGQKARAAVALMFFAGLRPGEARGVCWEDFDGKRLLYAVQSGTHTRLRQRPRVAQSLCLLLNAPQHSR